MRTRRATTLLATALGALSGCVHGSPPPCEAPERGALASPESTDRTSAPSLSELLRNLRTEGRWREAATALAARTEDIRAILAAFDAMLRQTMEGERRPFLLSRTGNSIEQCVKDERCRVRWAIATAVRPMGERAAPLADVLLDLDLRDEAEVHAFSWGSLVASQFGSSAIPPIRKRLASPDEMVRVQGLQVLRKMGERGAEAIPAMRSLALHDPAWNVRIHAIEAEAHAAPDDPRVRSDVEFAASHDPDERVRAHAQWAAENVLTGG